MLFAFFTFDFNYSNLTKLSCNSYDEVISAYMFCVYVQHIRIILVIFSELIGSISESDRFGDLTVINIVYVQLCIIATDNQEVLVVKFKLYVYYMYITWDILNGA